MVPEKIYELIAKSLTDSLTKDESDALNKWGSENNENKEEYEDIAELWRKSDKLKFPGEIDTRHALKTVQKHGNIKRRLQIGIIGQVAAILLVSLIFSGIFSYFIYKPAAEKSVSAIYQEVKSALGTQTNVTLADGTVVLLNSGSTLRFPNSFDHSDKRHVELKGEGFFKVTEDKQKPFIVNAGKLDIKVLGTTFNVNAYDPHSEITVALVEGEVAISKANAAPAASLMHLLPNQLAQFDESQNKIFKKSNIDLTKYTSWIEGKIIFLDEPITDVVKKLEQWYNVEIVLADKKISNYRFTGTFFNESLEEILHILSQTSPMQYEIIEAEKKEDDIFTKRKIIIKSS